MHLVVVLKCHVPCCVQAMHLVVCAREKKPMPATLPVNLVPPSKRKSDSSSLKASTPPAVPNVCLIN